MERIVWGMIHTILLFLSLTLSGRATSSSDTVVLLIDFQHDFASTQGAWPADSTLSAQAIASASALVQHARARGWPVVRTANAFSPWDPGNLFRRHAAVRGTPGARWVMQDTLPNEPLFTKTGSNAFGSDSLSEWFENHPGSTIWIAGFFAEGCALSTAEGARKRGHRVLSAPELVASTDSTRWRKGWQCLRRNGVEGAEVPFKKH